ncbi:MAG: DUF3048 domain-containing protein [Chloroflexota bacterium]
MSTARPERCPEEKQGRTSRLPGKFPAIAILVAVLVLGAPLLLWLGAEGQLTLVSEPADAEVWRDGQLQGHTPYTLTTRFSPLTGTLEVRRAGFENREIVYVVEPRQQASLSAVLTPTVPTVTTGIVEVRSQPGGAAIIFDGKPVGSAPLTLDGLAAGRHQLRVGLPLYAEHSQVIDLAAGETVHVEARLQPLPGSLAIASTPPQATVFLDGQERGQTPLVLEALTAGEHELKLVRKGYVELQRKVTIGPNARMTTDVPLAKKEMTPALQRPIAVMVDNHPYALPQAGLAEADIVYEALAEGGITRYMPIYMSKVADVVGPVRSARHYFIYWADEYNAAYVHCGGYNEAYAALAATGLADMDDLKGSPGFWRGSDRPAPHNLYTSTPALRAEADRRGLKKESSGTGGLLFGVEPETVGKPAGAVTIQYPYDYQIRWQYDPAHNDYLRFRAGSPHVDRASGAQLRGANVVVLYMRNWFLGGDDQQDFQLTGSGKALYFLNGQVVEGKWTRASLGEPTLYWTATDERIDLNWGGTTWIQVVPADAEVTVES